MMKMQKIEPWVRWMSIPIVAIVPYWFADNEDHQIYGFWMHWFHSIVFTGTYWNFAVWIFYYYRRRFPRINQTVKRLAITFFSIVFMILAVSPILKLLLGLDTFQEIFTVKSIMAYLPVSLILSLACGTVYESVYYFEGWKKTVQENEALKNQQIRTQFEVLQNQMSPHFLFNSLNTLTSLISEDQNIAINFTQKLSDVYRYILQNKERELVSLKEELNFAMDYLYLLKMRYPDNLYSTFKIDAVHLTKYIAPLTLQMLIENAIKHNVISKSNPLSIEVYVDNGKSIVVKNNVKPKQALERSTKTGLSNIRKRYQYLGNREIDIIHTDGYFMVAIPLIEMTREEIEHKIPLAEVS
jgi:two-component system LytT family sensor kinase